MTSRACFIDRDGVVNKMGDRGENHINESGRKQRFTAPWSYREFEFLPRIWEGLELLGSLGLVRVLVTNQPDIAYGHLSQFDHEKIMAEVGRLPWDDVFVCLHPAAAGCECHKPKPGMLVEAARRWRIDLKESFIIGDTQSDMGAGHAVGCKTVLVKADYNQGLEADFYAESFFGAVLLIQQLFKKGG